MSRNTIIAINLFFVAFNFTAALYNYKKGKFGFSITHIAFLFINLFFSLLYLSES